MDSVLGLKAKILPLRRSTIRMPPKTSSARWQHPISPTTSTETTGICSFVIIFVLVINFCQTAPNGDNYVRYTTASNLPCCPPLPPLTKTLDQHQVTLLIIALDCIHSTTPSLLVSVLRRTSCVICDPCFWRIGGSLHNQPRWRSFGNGADLNLNPLSPLPNALAHPLSTIARSQNGPLLHPSITMLLPLLCLPANSECRSWSASSTTPMQCKSNT